MPDDPTIDQRLTALEQLHANFQIIGGSNVTVEGSIHKGYAICSTCPDTGQPSGGGVIPVTPPSPTGACCVGTDCTIETESDCVGMDGTYQGDNTTCDPNPCEEPCTDPCCGYHIAISGTLSGNLGGISLSATASAERDLGLDDCGVCSDGTDELTYGTCIPPGAHPTIFLTLCGSISFFGGNWFAHCGINLFSGDICGGPNPHGSHADNFLGISPVGVHDFSYNDADFPTVHWDMTIIVTAI